MGSIINFLQSEMERPKSFGIYHIIWVLLTAFTILYFNKTKKLDSEKRLKRILLIYGIISLILELIKQIIWSYDNGVWDYQFYAAPFQFCTTPIYVSILYGIINNKKIKDGLLCYLAFFTILGGLSVIIYPETCFCKTIEVNIHTMFLHCGSFVISTYILMNNHIKLNIKNVFKGLKVFIVFIVIALILNISFYNSGILNGETFNMFYISPYFISSLPVFDMLQERLPYILFLISYISIITIGALIILYISKLFKKKNT